MWVVVCGNMGLGKQVLIDYACKEEGFEHIPNNEFSDDDLFKRNMSYLKGYSDIMRQITARSPTQDIITSRWVLDSVYAFGSLDVDRSEMTIEEWDILRDEALRITSIFRIPDAILYIKSEETMPLMNRLAMKGNNNLDSLYIQQLEKKYEDYMSMLAIPVIEIIFKDQVDSVIDQVRYGMASIRGLRLTESTIWDRKVFI